MMTGPRLLAAACIAVMCGVPAAAQTTLYVDAVKGHDSVARASNSATSPWRTIGRAAWGSTNRDAPDAAQAARAGDVVMVAAGTYDFDGVIGNRWGVVYNPVNQGDGPAAPITFRAAGKAILNAPKAASPVIGCYSKNYVIWEGPFELSEATIRITPDTGAVVLTNARGCGVDGISIDGHHRPEYRDNHTGVRIEGCQSCFVRNSTITRIYDQRGSHNGSAVMLYNSDDIVIENNHIFDVHNAVFIKGVFGAGDAQTATVVRHNMMANCGECITVQDSQDARIYQNVVRNSFIALNLLARTPDPLDHPRGDWFVNNTIDNMSGSCIYLGGGPWHERVRVWNNIFTACAIVISRHGDTFPKGREIIDWQHNNYFGFRRFADDSSPGDVDQRQWVEAFGQDAAAPASVTFSPAYVNAAAGDFRLCNRRGAPAPDCRDASKAIGIGIDILDLDGDGSTTDMIAAGAFVTNSEVIGPRRQR